ncbi:MAG: hypothetical protein A2017_20320 [Lentisphaerae bacterium GWF2_44_16]|nr:MAG: hypothetical protein A2017_20320 [Lentisphaerae bacterium GWF2_44_16]
MKKKKVFVLLLLLLLLVVSNIVTGFISYRCGVFIAFFNFSNSNLKHTEQIKFLLDSIDKRLKNNDKELLRDISEFNKNYKVDYEGQPFMDLSKKYFVADFPKYSFFYQK